MRLLFADWVASWGAIVGLIVGVLSLIALVYGFTAFIMRKFKQVLHTEVLPIVEQLIKPIVEEQQKVRQELVIHMATEQALLATQTANMERHFRDDEVFQRETERRFDDQHEATEHAAGERSAILDAIHDLSDRVARPPE